MGKWYWGMGPGIGFFAWLEDSGWALLFSMTGSSSQLYLGKCWKREMVYEVGHGWSKFCQLFIQNASFRPRIWVFCRTLWIFKPNSLFVSYDILRTYCNLQNHPFSYKAAWLAGVSNHPFETNKFIKLGIISPMFEVKQKIWNHHQNSFFL